ncbi:MAG: DUF692 family protein [Geminicoccaceae bacterium]
MSSTLVERYEPGLVSEHLAWSSHEGAHFNDLLPCPTRMERWHGWSSMSTVCREGLGRPILLENPSSHLTFEESTLAEPAFLGEIARRSGCGLLLDLNNVFVSSQNLGFTPESYIDPSSTRSARSIWAGMPQSRMGCSSTPMTGRGGSGLGASGARAATDRRFAGAGRMGQRRAGVAGAAPEAVLAQRLLDNCRHARAG